MHESSEVLLARVEERGKALEKSFKVHQDYTSEKLDSLEKYIKQVLEQTTKTNGRVTEIEDKRLPQLEHWRSRQKGYIAAVFAIAGFISFVVTLIVTLWKN